MPVQEQTPYIKYVANGVTQTFSTEFDCESKDQLVVMLNGEEPSFTSWSYADKQVTFLIAPVVDTVVELKRQSKLNRTTDYQSFNHTLNYRALNSDFDRIWYAIQEQNYKVGQYDYDYNFVLTQVRPIATGGTGANNPNDARNNLNTYSKEEVNALIATGGEGNVVGIAGGGTGATTAAEARANLEVMSSTEVETAINNATPQATHTALGVAKIATTAIAQAGTNDTDIITAKKLLDFIKSNVIKNDFVDVKSSRVQGVVYTNPSTSSYLNVRINAVVPVGGFIEAYVSNKLEMKTTTSGGGSWGEYMFLLVPPLGTYKLVAVGTTISYWGEA